MNPFYVAGAAVGTTLGLIVAAFLVVIADRSRS